MANIYEAGDWELDDRPSLDAMRAMAIREQHRCVLGRRWMNHDTQYCVSCQTVWPCQTIMLLAEVECLRAIEAAARAWDAAREALQHPDIDDQAALDGTYARFQAATEALCTALGPPPEPRP